jgi:hypothetical protein
MAEPMSSNAPRQLMQLGATFLAAAGVAWALGADWKAVALILCVAAALGVGGAILRRGKRARR